MKPDPSKPNILSEDDLSDNDDLLQEDTQTMEGKEIQERQKDGEEDDLLSNEEQENVNEEELSTEEGLNHTFTQCIYLYSAFTCTVHVHVVHVHFTVNRYTQVTHTTTLGGVGSV